MAPEQKAASKTRRLPCSASGGRCMGSGADSEGHPRPRGRQERRKGHFRGRLSRSMGGGGPASEERPLPSSRPPRREVMKPVPLPLDPPALGVSGTDDDDSWASSFTWRTSREIVRICFAAWNGLRAFSEDDSWASAHEWQSSRDTMRCFFSAWSVTRASIEAGKLGMLDTDVASLTGATPGIRSRDPPNSGSHRAAVVGVVSRPPLGQQRPGQELVDARKEKREPVLEVSSGFVSAVGECTSGGGEACFSRYLAADDCILGPDGGCYEVFYPRGGSGPAQERTCRGSRSRCRRGRKCSYQGAPRDTMLP
uniref:Uncharacterized protein n=1 Tax=Pyrodinium bahamense TaxID=73915 RepID=A0A7S0AGN3_9DINO